MKLLSWITFVALAVSGMAAATMTVDAEHAVTHRSGPKDAITTALLGGGHVSSPLQADEGAASSIDRSGERRSIIDRFILPSPRLSFEGETGRRSMTFVLTEEQATNPVNLVVTFNSSIFVAPEASRLRIAVNDTHLKDASLVAKGRSSSVAVPIPPGLAKTGRNRLTFAVEQRHRTDCTVNSTYDLWTEIRGEGTGLMFGDGLSRVTAFDDLAAVGFDANGTTTIRVVAPGNTKSLRQELLRLVQAVALAGEFPEPIVEIATTMSDSPPPGVVQLAVGTARELSDVLGYSPDALSVHQVGFLTTPSPTLFVSGPDEKAIGEAVEQVVRYVERLRRNQQTGYAASQSVPFLEGDRRLTFAELGVPSTRFDGRRFHTDFHVALPQDFYANAYGKAILYLDAAYTEDVKRGESISVYVNGSAAASMPLTSNRGQIFNHVPIKVPLTHFRPGPNHVVIEAKLESAEDETCLIPASHISNRPDRFAIFDTSEFRMPDFGRIDRWPELSALAGAGAPYADSHKPVHVVFGRQDKDVLEAAATFIVRLAVSSGRFVPVAVSQSPPRADEPAILFGTLSDFTKGTLVAMGIKLDAQTSWRLHAARAEKTAVDGKPATPPRSNPVTEGSDSIADRNPQPTRSTRPASGASGQVLGDRAAGVFQQIRSSLSRSFAVDEPFHPNERARLIVAAAPASSERPWTLVAAPAMDYFVEDVREIVKREHWQQMSGKIASYRVPGGLEPTSAQYHRYSLGSRLTFSNIRLVAANWLSENVFIFAAALVLGCVVLGLFTSFMVARLGNKP